MTDGDLTDGFESADIVVDAALRSARIRKILEIILTDFSIAVKRKKIYNLKMQRSMTDASDVAEREINILRRDPHPHNVVTL